MREESTQILLISHVLNLEFGLQNTACKRKARNRIENLNSKTSQALLPSFLKSLCKSCISLYLS